MEKIDAISALAALAQDNRLDVFRLLVQAGQGGMAAGQVAETLGLAPAECVFIDDMEANVAAAAACGMTAVLHTEAAATAAVLHDLLGAPAS